MAKEKPKIALRMEQSKLARAYLEMKKILREAGRHEDAESVTAYTLADSLEEATAAFPTVNGKIVVLKECHPENARLIAHSEDKRQMQEFCKEFKDG